MKISNFIIRSEYEMMSCYKDVLCYCLGQGVVKTVVAGIFFVGSKSTKDLFSVTMT